MFDQSEHPPQQLKQLLADLTPRQAEFLRHYLDREGPAFGNATRAAELAGYSGDPGSNQLAVQGARILKNPHVRECLDEALAAAGCTVELDAQVLREAMAATQTKCFLGENNEIVAGPPQPDHAVRLRAVDLKHRLVRASRPINTHKPAPDSSGTTEFAATETLPPEYVEAISQVAKLSATDRVLLREVALSDERLANSNDTEPDRSGES